MPIFINLPVLSRSVYQLTSYDTAHVIIEILNYYCLNIPPQIKPIEGNLQHTVEYESYCMTQSLVQTFLNRQFAVAFKLPYLYNRPFRGYAESDYFLTFSANFHQIFPLIPNMFALWRFVFAKRRIKTLSKQDRI